MDPEQTFIRVQERFSQMITLRIRTALEYFYLFSAITLFAILVVMHANFVQQPGCSSELSGVQTTEAQLIFVKITGIGLLIQKDSEPNFEDISPGRILIDEPRPREPDAHDDEFNLFAVNYWFGWITSGARRGKLNFKFWKNYYEYSETQPETIVDGRGSKLAANDGRVEREEPSETFSMFSKQSARAVILHFFRKWHRRLTFIWKHGTRLLGTLWNVAGIRLNLDIPKWLRILHLDRLNLFAVLEQLAAKVRLQKAKMTHEMWLERKIKAFEPSYLYTMEKGYFLLPEEAKSRHNIRTANISISARHPCFGNRWQQLLINRVVGYDTILMNSLLDAPGQGRTQYTLPMLCNCSDLNTNAISNSSLIPAHNFKGLLFGHRAHVLAVNILRQLLQSSLVSSCKLVTVKSSTSGSC